MERIYHSTPSFDRYQAPDPAAVATGKIVKYKDSTPKKVPRKSKGKGKEQQKGEFPQEAVAATELPSTSTSKATYETVRPIVEEVKHDISRPQAEKEKKKETDSKGQAHTAATPSATAKMAPSSHDTTSSSSSKRKRDKDIKSSHRKDKKGRSSSRGPPLPRSKSIRKKSRKETSSPESNSSRGASSDTESSGSEEEDDEDSSSEESRAAEEQEKLRRKRARSSSKGRSKSVTRGRARSKSRGRYSDSESDTDSSPDGTPFKEPIFIAVTEPNGDTRVRTIDPAIHFPDLLELCYALSNIHQETPIHLSYKLEKLTVQLKDEDDLKAMLEAAILREFQVHIRIQKVEASPLPPSLPPSANVVVSNGSVDTPQAKKRKTGPRKVADTENKEAKARTSSVQATAQRDSETSDEEPLSTFKAETTQNGHPSISLQGKDNVPLAKVVIKEGGEGSGMEADAGSVAPAAKSSEVQGEIAGVGDDSVPAVKKEKRKRRSAEQIRLDNEKKEAEKAAKVAAKEAAKEAKKEERKKARQAEKAAAKAEKQRLDKEEAEQAQRAKVQREDEERKVEEEKKAKEERERKVREEEEAKKASEAEAAAKKKQTQEAKTKPKAKKSPDGKDGKVEAQKKLNGVEAGNSAIAATPSKEQPEDKKTKAVKEKGGKEKSIEDETVESLTIKEKSASDSPAKKSEGSKKMSPVKKAGAAAATEGKDSSTTPAPAKSVSNANGSAVPAQGKEMVPTVKKIADVNGAVSTQEGPSRPVKANKIYYKCHICFAVDHSMMQCPIIEAGTRTVERRLHQLKEKKKHKTKMENEACKLLEGWLQSNRQHEEKEKQGLMNFRRTHPDHEISKALSEQERQEDEEEQREINAAMERERQRIKERAEKTRSPSMSPTAGRESVKDIIDKVHRGGADKGGGQRDAIPNAGKSPSPIKGLDASSEVDQLEGTQSSPGLYPPLPRSVSKKGPLSSPTPSESELATSPMLMASGGLKNPLMDNIKEVSLPASAEASEQEGQASDRSSDTSDDSADEDELESDDEPEEGRSGEKSQRDASESIATSSDREANVGQEEDEDEVEEEEEEDQIEATPAPAKPNAKSGWMPSLGSIFGLKSSQDQPISQRETMTETQESGPPSAQRSRVGVAGAKVEPVTPSFSSRPRLAGGTRLSELDTSKVRSSFSQPNTPIGIASSQPTTTGKSSVSAKRKAEISFDTDSEDDHSEDSDSDNEAKRPSASLPLAKRAGQKQSKRPRSSLLAKMTPS